MEKQPVNNLVELIGSAFLKGWDANEYTTKKLCEVYIEQIQICNEKLRSDNISKKERKFYNKQKEKAIEGLEYADYTNKIFIAKVFSNIVLSLVSIYKVLEVIKKTNN